MGKIADGIKTVFTYMRLFNISYFVMNIIEFWNLTLMYNFLLIYSVPNFVEILCSRMMNFFFSYNSLTTEINKLFKSSQADETEEFIDVSHLTFI